MMRRKNAPGCKCCGCVADASHMCVCACPTPFPNTASTSDDLGTHVLSLPAPGATTLQGNHNISTTIYRNFLGSCTPDGSIWQIFYRLLWDCPGSVAFPAGRWRLSVEARIVVCAGFPNPGSPSPGGGGFWNAVDAADWTCDPDAVLEFDIPDVFTSSASPGVTYLNPGGGGIMTVTFG